MREFFRGWRRKVGCVTLVMAIAFTIGWVRSTIMADFVGAICDGTTTYYAVSYDGLLALQRTSEWSQQETIESGPDDSQLTTVVPTAVPRTPQSSSILWGSLQRLWFHQRIGVRVSNFDVFWSEYSIEWKREFCNIQIMTANDGNHRVVKCVIPYWSLAIPLTALSTFLLLAKPRSSIQKKTPEPITA